MAFPNLILRSGLDYEGMGLQEKHLDEVHIFPFSHVIGKKFYGEKKTYDDSVKRKEENEGKIKIWSTIQENRS